MTNNLIFCHFLQHLQIPDFQQNFISQRHSLHFGSRPWWSTLIMSRIHRWTDLCTRIQYIAGSIFIAIVSVLPSHSVWNIISSRLVIVVIVVELWLQLPLWCLNKSKVSSNLNTLFKYQLVKFLLSTTKQNWSEKTQLFQKLERKFY